ncbi:MAG: Rpp14/Pop5 family protein [archaeon]
MQKKVKLSIVNKALRDKKRYIVITLLNSSNSKLPILNKEELYRQIERNFENIFGIIKASSANILVMDAKDNNILIRVNKNNLEELISSLFFLRLNINNSVSIIKFKSISSTMDSAGF